MTLRHGDCIVSIEALADKSMRIRETEILRACNVRTWLSCQLQNVDSLLILLRVLLAKGYTVALANDLDT